MRREITYRCEDCGKTVTRRRRPHQPLTCIECSIERCEANAHGLNQRSGPAMQRWAAGMARAAQAALANDGLAPPVPELVYQVPRDALPGMRRTNVDRARRVREFGS